MANRIGCYRIRYVPGSYPSVRERVRETGGSGAQFCTVAPMIPIIPIEQLVHPYFPEHNPQPLPDGWHQTLANTRHRDVDLAFSRVASSFLRVKPIIGFRLCFRWLPLPEVHCACVIARVATRQTPSLLSTRSRLSACSLVSLHSLVSLRLLVFAHISCHVVSR